MKTNILYCLVVMLLMVLPTVVFGQEPPAPPIPPPPPDPASIPLSSNLTFLLAAATFYGVRRIKLSN